MLRVVVVVVVVTHVLCREWEGDASALWIYISLPPFWPFSLSNSLVLFVTFVAVPQRNPHGTSSGLGGFKRGRTLSRWEVRRVEVGGLHFFFFFLGRVVWLSCLLVEGSRSRRDCVPLVVGWLAGLYVIQVSGVGSKQKTVGPQLATGTERSLRRPLDVSFGSKEASPYDVFRLLLLLLLLVCVFLLQYYSATQLFNEYSFCSIAIQFNDISEYVIVVSFWTYRPRLCAASEWFFIASFDSSFFSV
jgi:hypothetical protein